MQRLETADSNGGSECDRVSGDRHFDCEAEAVKKCMKDAINTFYGTHKAGLA
jgi:hypothetical protein